MAEIPEVETARRDLDRELAKRKIRVAELPGLKKMVPGSRSKPAFCAHLVGRTVEGVGRMGTLLEFNIGEGESLFVDLADNAYFRRHASRDKVEQGTAMVLTFVARSAAKRAEAGADDAPKSSREARINQIRLIDPDCGSRMRIVSKDRLKAVYPDVCTHGFDPIEDPVPWPKVREMLASEHRTLRELLMDDDFVIGIGPVYCDEALHAAQLRWNSIASELNTQEVRRLHQAVIGTINNAVKHRGNSIHGQLDLDGQRGRFDEWLEVYGRAGERCVNGRGDVQSIELDGITHYYCDYQVERLPRMGIPA